MLLAPAGSSGLSRFQLIEVMGSLPENEDAFFTEDSPFEPNSPYAASKAAGGTSSFVPPTILSASILL